MSENRALNTDRWMRPLPAPWPPGFRNLRSRREIHLHLLPVDMGGRLRQRLPPVPWHAICENIG